MAFPLSNNQRDIANRKLLEDLHLKKQILLKQGTASTLNPTALPLLGSAIQLQGNETQPLNSHHHKALLQANSQSTGYFISQESSFGNLILPVLPRFDSKPT
ncbi:SOSS complex subunit C homolog [Harmonia axyridis]|uniref:SOSS complex subunit C homolog n=1 Tax=Harmonia axyridis TaxID=115357 RepID=UPI001E2773A0|nr:SOSS complex subunit C homolog [Harmonia axyridis]